MKLVEAGEKGVSVRLSDQCQDKIFTDVTEDGKDIVIVKGRVVRVDQPGARMGIALNQEIPDPEGKRKAYTLLVETKEAPTVIAQPLNVQLQAADKEQQRAILEAEARRQGFSLLPAPVAEGDSTSLFNGKTIAGETTAPSDGQGLGTDVANAGDAPAGGDSGTLGKSASTDKSGAVDSSSKSK